MPHRQALEAEAVARLSCLALVEEVVVEGAEEAWLKTNVTSNLHRSSSGAFFGSRQRY